MISPAHVFALQPMLMAWWAHGVHAWHRWRREAREQSEIARMSEVELRDLGVSRSELL